jgi:hypothetical protein
LQNCLSLANSVSAAASRDPSIGGLSTWIQCEHFLSRVQRRVDTMFSECATVNHPRKISTRRSIYSQKHSSLRIVCPLASFQLSCNSFIHSSFLIISRLSVLEVYGYLNVGLRCFTLTGPTALPWGDRAGDRVLQRTSLVPCCVKAFI